VNATASGYNAQATADNALALGAGAQASVANSVALGSNSVTAVRNTGDYTITGGAIAGTASAGGTVSIGAAGAERQIQNVGAGVLSATSTDAVNGSQLYAAARATNTAATGAANSLGGGANWDATTGAWTGPTYKVQGNSYNNVGDALGAVDNSISSLNNSVNTLSANVAGLWQNVNALQGSVQRGYEGSAVAIASSGAPNLSPGKKFAVFAKWGTFRNQNAFGGTALLRVADNAVLTASFGGGMRYGGVGGGVGGLVEW
jgi:autotransporter adhesin